ncbi:MAG TPA: hypothetical protein VGB39_03560, partial [Sphingomicrobium sp.]
MKGPTLTRHPAKFRAICLFALAAVAAGCAATQDKPERRIAARVTVEPPTRSEAWMQLATPADKSRIARLALAWQSALADARPRFAGEIRKEGVLLNPRA